MIRSIFVVFAFFAVQISFATDSLSYVQFLEKVIQQNPIFKLVELELDYGKAERRFGRGSIEPKLFGSFDQKTYKESLYYQKLNLGFKVPTPLGIDLVGGFEQNSGIYLNPENKVPSNGLYGLGVEVNPFALFWSNQQAAELRIGGIRYRNSKFASRIQFNQILFGASKAYFEYLQYSEINNVINQTIDLAIQYKENTVSAYQNGEKSAIDTLEAQVYLEDAKIEWHANQAKLRKAEQMLLLYVFEEQNSKIEDNAYQPKQYWVEFPDGIELSPSLNPNLNLKVNSLEEYSVKRRLSAQDILPKVKLKYQPLLYLSGEEQQLIYSENNYKVGIGIEASLFQTQKRAKYQMNRLKEEIASQELLFYRKEVRNKFTALNAELDALNKQYDRLSKNVTSYFSLLEAEQIKFQLGESSVFLLNKRQEKYLDGMQKLAKLNKELQLKKLEILLNFSDISLEELVRK